jgi:hypothetical protein
MSTRFDEKNCNAQCRSCNRFDEGNIPGYSLGLIKKYGFQIVEILMIKKHTIFRISQSQINLMNKFYLKEIKKLLDL